MSSILNSASNNNNKKTIEQSNLDFSTSLPVDAEKTEVLVNSTNNFDEIILQCAVGDVSNISEKLCTTTCLLFDGGSQRTYITDRLQNELELKCIRKEKLIVKRFASSEGVLKCLDVVQFCLRGNGVKIYMEALCVPHICSTIKVPSIGWTKGHYKYLQDLDLVKPPTDFNDVDILVGLDYYYSVISGRVIRGSPGDPVAVESVLGWMVCGRSGGSSGSNEVFTNLIVVEDDLLEDKLDLKSELTKFWQVETLHGDINDIVHENFNENINFNGERYVTSLPF